MVELHTKNTKEIPYAKKTLIDNTEAEVDEFLAILAQALEVCKGEFTAFNPEY